ncbi:MAG: PAS domain-containing sensor histidine kinase [Sulfurimonas sp.]|jgi:PAS domain S-box-containing protein
MITNNHTLESLKVLSFEEIKELIEELEVHKIELKMQNEQLMEAQIDLHNLKKRYFNLYKMAPLGYCTITKDDVGLIEEVNFFASNLFGLAHNKLIKLPITSFIYEEDQDIYYLFSKKISLHNTDEKHICELRIQNKNGTLFWVRLSATSYADNPLILLIMTDISELKAHEEELKFKINTEVAESRKKDLIMFQQARFASLGEMMANIAHQWRQPLSSLMMIIQGFQTKFELGKLTSEIVAKKVNDAIFLGNNMSKTLEDFQEFFKPTRDKEDFFLKACLKHAFYLSKYILDEKKIEVYIKVEDGVEINGFYNELSQVFLNIISNSKDALSSKDYKRVIEVTAVKSENTIKIDIVDNGGGIDEEILPHIFDPYYTTKYKNTGTGIGLYMSKQIIEKHMQGRVTCKNIFYNIGNQESEHCALFTITIPTNKGDQNAS